MLCKNYDPTVMGKLTEQVSSITKPFPKIRIVGSGGNINKLYKLISRENPGLNNFLPVNLLKDQLEKMQSMTVEERMEKYDLRADRADVIVPAVKVFLNIAKSANVSEIYVPTLGLVDAMIEKIGMEVF